jgi:hypothetical protein
VCQLDGPGDTGAESDAIVRARNIVVHGLGNTHDLDALFVKPLGVTERIVSTDRYEAIDPEKLQVLENIGCDVVDLLGVIVLKMLRQNALGKMTGTRSRRMNKSPSGPARAIDDLLGQDLNAVAVVGVLVSDQVDQPGPTTPDSEYPVSFPKGTKGDRTNSRVETRDITSSS